MHTAKLGSLPQRSMALPLVLAFFLLENPVGQNILEVSDQFDIDLYLNLHFT